MSERVVVDPITRIEGHLRIEAQTDGDRITEAYSSGTMVRGIEIILRGRLGICTTHLWRLYASSWHRIGARGGRRVEV